MDRCSACPGLHNCIGPEGPDDAEIMLVGEKPGWEEDKKGIPFVGKTGKEVDGHYLPLAGLRRENVLITNAMACWGGEGAKDRLDMGRERDRNLLLSCAEHQLYPLIQRVKPKLLVPMGAFACYALDPEIDLTLQHGIPLETSWGTVFPLFHPSAGLHEPKKMLQIRTDWDRLKKYLRGQSVRACDPYAGREDYRCLDSPSDVKKVLQDAGDSPLACDTEIKKYNKRDPYCLTFSCQPGTGFMLRAGDDKTLVEFQNQLRFRTGPVLFHNWLFDCDVTRALGLDFPAHLIRDTMVRVFHLGNLPQGLKALAYRLLGMQMQDFDDLVTPYSTPLALEYLETAMGQDWPKPEEQLVRDPETNLWKLYKPQSMNTKLKRFFTDLSKNPAIDVFERWKNWESYHPQMEERLGTWPGKCITHAPFEESLFYACRDVDATLRLWPILQKMKAKVRETTQENWM